jgi:hypothetical protein
MTTLADSLVNKLLAISGVEEGRSRWPDSEALLYRGKEVLHFDQPDLVDLRLGRRAIRAHREVELNDRRVTLRGQSDWVNVRLTSPEDVEFIFGLFRDILVE